MYNFSSSAALLLLSSSSLYEPASFLQIQISYIWDDITDLISTHSKVNTEPQPHIKGTCVHPFIV